MRCASGAAGREPDVRAGRGCQGRGPADLARGLLPGLRGGLQAATLTLFGRASPPPPPTHPTHRTLRTAVLRGAPP